MEQNVTQKVTNRYHTYHMPAKKAKKAKGKRRPPSQRQKPAKMKAALEAIKNGRSRTSAAAAAGVDRTTLHNWMTPGRPGYDKKFEADVDAAELAAIGSVEDVAKTCAMLADQDPKYQTAMIFWLKAKAGWRDRDTADSGTDDAPSPVTSLNINITDNRPPQVSTGAGAGEGVA